MKLIQKIDLVRGQMIPDAFISFGNHHIGGKYLCINFPLYVLDWMYDGSSDSYIFGWYTPSIRIVTGLHQFVVSWYYMFRSNFMGEEKIRRNSLYGLPIYCKPRKEK
jgi:hypothetical protein